MSRTRKLREVVAAFDTLAEEQRQVLLLAVLEQFSYRQVADVLGIPLGTVMSRLFRARERLRGTLRSSGDLERKLVNEDPKPSEADLRTD